MRRALPEPDDQRDDTHPDAEPPFGVIGIGVLDHREAWASQAQAGEAEHQTAK